MDYFVGLDPRFYSIDCYWFRAQTVTGTFEKRATDPNWALFVQVRTMLYCVKKVREKYD